MNPMQFAAAESLTLYIRTPRMLAGTPIRDAYGVVQYDQTTRVITGVAIWPLGTQRSSLSTGENRTETFDRTDTSYTAAIPPDVNVAAIDRAEWKGKIWEVEGESDRYSNPFTGAALQTIRLNRVEG